MCAYTKRGERERKRFCDNRSSSGGERDENGTRNAIIDNNKRCGYSYALFVIVRRSCLTPFDS